jgi:anti-anti-sigma regulatory factor
MTALCAYDTRRSEPDAIADVACVHPSFGGGAPAPPFRLSTTGSSLVLEGDVDLDSEARFLAALAGAAAIGDELHLDLSATDFLGVSAMHHLATWIVQRRDAGVHVEITGVSRTVRRCWQLLGYDVA